MRICLLRAKHILQISGFYFVYFVYRHILNWIGFFFFLSYEYYNEQTEIIDASIKIPDIYSSIRTFPHKTQFFRFDLCHMKKLSDNYLVNAVKPRFFLFSLKVFEIYY